ncbi:MAG: FHA domain-containing protein [Gammaproteobacteria bacterium]|nr:FHA domain-containing protein [Gammaproteobacteria bacterium]MDH3768855.1 FHA domain-containing protein [Gammaproteobacteria bacterium]
MARLLLSLDGQVLAEYNMNKERYTVGRLPDNDVRIDNPAVSGHHALVINILNDSFLEDLNSTNGTYVNGKLIKKHALQHGDVITIGHHQLRFVDEQTEDAGADEFEKTMIIRPGMTGGPSEQEINAAVAQVSAPVLGALPGSAPEVSHGSTATVEPALRSATATTAERKALPTAKLQVLSGAFAGKELSLVKALTTLGRPGVQVAAITRRAEGYFVVHVESGQAGNYPMVNGTPIGPQARKLTDNDVIELAGVKMGFFTT